MSKTLLRSLDRLRLPELQQRYRDVLGEETRCPNRTFLVRRIAEALTGRAEAASAAPPATPPARPETPAKRRKATAAPSPAKPVRGRFASMTVEELQTAYASTVGRPTSSENRAYLQWKIREAEKGRVPIGPRETRTADQEAAGNMKILPLRLSADAVEALDAAWRERGMKSRMDLFRRALGHYLGHVGARAAAEMFQEA